MFGGLGVPVNTRTQNKATVQKVAALKFVNHHAKALAGFNGLYHRNQSYQAWAFLSGIEAGHIHRSGSLQRSILPISSLLPPLSSNFWAVITMYTKNTMHDWIPSASSVGTPSYIYTSVCQPLIFRRQMVTPTQSSHCVQSLKYYSKTSAFIKALCILRPAVDTDGEDQERR
ncbi:hypothetical protein B0H10DRAFT_1972755 [Mycena sp. CBHHK59/15]|nr:hypothetical protein B0H10DRAFT_1972755 [Mycena sp. CBHHK59/15]